MLSRKKERQFRSIHGALLLAILCHILAIFAYVVFASKPPEEQIRIVAQVDVVDALEAPPPPPPARKLGVKAPPPPKVYGASAPANYVDAEAGPKAPGPKANEAGKGNPGDEGAKGGSGRAGLRTHVDPNLPSVGADNFGGRGYPVGHGKGRGNKEGTGSGFGQGDGEGEGPGTGTEGDGKGGGGQGGGGAGGGGYLGQVVFDSYDDRLTPTKFQADEGLFVFSFRNSSSEVRTLKVEGTGGDFYGKLWANVNPGQVRTYTIDIHHGYYTITIRDAQDLVVQGAFLQVNQVLGR